MCWQRSSSLNSSSMMSSNPFAWRSRSSKSVDLAGLCLVSSFAHRVDERLNGAARTGGAHVLARLTRSCIFFGIRSSITARSSSLGSLRQRRAFDASPQSSVWTIREWLLSTPSGPLIFTNADVRERRSGHATLSLHNQPAQRGRMQCKGMVPAFGGQFPRVGGCSPPVGLSWFGRFKRGAAGCRDQPSA